MVSVVNALASRAVVRGCRGGEDESPSRWKTSRRAPLVLGGAAELVVVAPFVSSRFPACVSQPNRWSGELEEHRGDDSETKVGRKHDFATLVRAEAG